MGVARMTLAASALFALSACEDAEAPAAPPEATVAVAPVIVQDRFSVSRSAFDAPTTLERLFEALDRRELTVFAVIDHAANAEAVGAELPFSTVVVFGSPEAGTPLIRAVPLMGAALPLRALVYEQGGEVFLAVTGVDNLSRDVPPGEQAAVIEAIRQNLREISAEVAAG